MALLNLEDIHKEFDALLKKAELVTSGQGSELLALNSLAARSFNPSAKFAEQDFPPPSPESVAEADKLLLEIYSLIQADQALGPLRQSVDALYQKLKSSLKSETALLAATQARFTELSVSANKVQTAWRFGQESQAEFGGLRAEIAASVALYQSQLEKEAEARAKAEELRGRVGLVDAGFQEEIERVQRQVARQLEQHQSARKDIEQTNAELLQRIALLDGENQALDAEIRAERLAIGGLQERHQRLREEFALKEEQIQTLDEKIAAVNKEIAAASEHTKELEKRAEDLRLLISKGSENAKELTRAIKGQAGEKEALKERQVGQQHELGLLEKEAAHFATLKENTASQVSGLAAEIAEVEKKLAYVKAMLKKEQKSKFSLLRQIKESRGVLVCLEEEKTQMEIKRSHAAENLRLLETQFELESAQRSENFGDKEDMQLAVKKQQEKNHQLRDALHALEREVKTLENKVVGSKNIVRRLNDQAEALREQQEKYSQETAHAHAKFYQIIEDIKVKNYVIADLQESNKTLAKKLRQQKSLYEAVRNDRNVYQKSLLEMKANMETVTKEFQGLTHQANQVREDIKFREAEIETANAVHAGICAENAAGRQKKAVLKAKLKIQEQQIRAHEEELAKLKALIAEAHIERKRKLNIHESIINERDMLGNQFFKRNSELKKIVEKNLALKNFLELDQKHFEAINREMKDNFERLSSLTRHREELRELARAYLPLKQETIAVQRELLYTQSKNAAFECSLRQLLNIHPWKKLETTEPEKFEKIMQLGFLQKLLIERGSELGEIEEAIRKREEEFSRLKIIEGRILAKEGGLAVEDLGQRIKDKAYSVSQMSMELKEEQNKIVRLTLEIDIIRTKISGYEEEYFKRRRIESRREGN